MLRNIHLFLAALAMLVAPIAMQSGAAMAAMPMSQGAMADTGHCDEMDGEQSPPASIQCCVAMCSGIASQGALVAERTRLLVSVQPTLPRTAYPSFIAKLPTPPPRPA